MGPGGGDTLIFSYIRRLGSFLGVQNFEFQYFWEFPKKKYFLGYEDVDFFGGSSQNWTIFSGHFFRILGSFLKAKVQNRGYFWGCQKLKYFFFVRARSNIY